MNHHGWRKFIKISRYENCNPVYENCQLVTAGAVSVLSRTFNNYLNKKNKHMQKTKNMNRRNSSHRQLSQMPPAPPPPPPPPALSTGSFLKTEAQVPHTEVLISPAGYVAQMHRGDSQHPRDLSASEMERAHVVRLSKWKRGDRRNVMTSEDSCAESSACGCSSCAYESCDECSGDDFSSFRRNSTSLDSAVFTFRDGSRRSEVIDNALGVSDRASFDSRARGHTRSYNVDRGHARVFDAGDRRYSQENDGANWILGEKYDLYRNENTFDVIDCRKGTTGKTFSELQRSRQTMAITQWQDSIGDSEQLLCIENELKRSSSFPPKPNVDVSSSNQTSKQAVKTIYTQTSLPKQVYMWIFK